MSHLLCLVSTVYPISLYNRRHWTDEGLYQSVPFAMPCTYCPSHPTVPWEGLDERGLYQSVLFAMPCTYCPSHPIVPWEGLDGQRLYQSVPFTMPCTYLSIPSHCTMGGDGWAEICKLSFYYYNKFTLHKSIINIAMQN